MKTKILQFTSAKGPAECEQVVAQVLKTFIGEAEQSTIKHLVLNKEDGSVNGTVKSVTVKIEGREVEAFAKSWIGTIQWIGNSSFRKNHKRKNWYVGCFEIRQANELRQLLDTEIEYQTMRSSGPGGQHANKVSSAVRAVHLPTGTQVVASESRSQHQNRKLARLRLEEKLQGVFLSDVKAQSKEAWNQHFEVERGNPVRVFRGTDFKAKPKPRTNKQVRAKQKRDWKREMRVRED